jgi:hypothetical protein
LEFSIGRAFGHSNLIHGWQAVAVWLVGHCRRDHHPLYISRSKTISAHKKCRKIISIANLALFPSLGSPGRRPALRPSLTCGTPFGAHYGPYGSCPAEGEGSSSLYHIGSREMKFRHLAERFFHDRWKWFKSNGLFGQVFVIDERFAEI